MAKSIEAGQRVVLWAPDGRRFLLTVNPGTVRVPGLGVVRGEQVIGHQWGAAVRFGTSDFHVLPPTLRDALDTLERRAQIVLAKDSSRIVLECGIGPGSRVLEAGVGSAGITIVLAYAVGAEGRVFGFDVRDDHLRVARRNIERAGLSDRVELRQGDVADGIDVDHVDAIVLDVPDPGRVVPVVASHLAVGGSLACYTPLVSQMEAARDAMGKVGLGAVRSMEIIERSWINRGRGSRPDVEMLGHTGFLTFSRRVSP